METLWSDLALQAVSTEKHISDAPGKVVIGRSRSLLRSPCSLQRNLSLLRHRELYYTQPK